MSGNLKMDTSSRRFTASLCRQSLVTVTAAAGPQAQSQWCRIRFEKSGMTRRRRTGKVLSSPQTVTVDLAPESNDFCFDALATGPARARVPGPAGTITGRRTINQ